MPYSKGHVCLCVFPRDGQGWEGHSSQGSKENSSLMTDQMKAKKKEKGDYMLCNQDNGKENTGGLKCESLCPEECKRQGCFDIINQNFTRAPGRALFARSSMCKWPALGLVAQFALPGHHRQPGQAGGPGVALGSQQRFGHSKRWGGSLGQVVGGHKSHGESHQAGLLHWSHWKVTSNFSCVSASQCVFFHTLSLVPPTCGFFS